MPSVPCPNCGKKMSEEAAVNHCLDCAHPFDVTKWRQAYAEKRASQCDQEQQEQELRSAEEVKCLQSRAWQEQGKCRYCGGQLGVEKYERNWSKGYVKISRICSACCEANVTVKGGNRDFLMNSENTNQ